MSFWVCFFEKKENEEVRNKVRKERRKKSGIDKRGEEEKEGKRKGEER